MVALEVRSNNFDISRYIGIDVGDRGSILHITNQSGEVRVPGIEDDHVLEIDVLDFAIHCFSYQIVVDLLQLKKRHFANYDNIGKLEGVRFQSNGAEVQVNEVIGTYFDRDIIAQNTIGDTGAGDLTRQNEVDEGLIRRGEVHLNKYRNL